MHQWLYGQLGNDRFFHVFLSGVTEEYGRTQLFPSSFNIHTRRRLPLTISAVVEWVQVVQSPHHQAVQNKSAFEKASWTLQIKLNQGDTRHGVP